MKPEGREPRLVLGRAINRKMATAKRMARTAPTPDGPIRVQLDARTVITLLNMKALKFWRQRYPKLVVL